MISSTGWGKDAMEQRFVIDLLSSFLLLNIIYDSESIGRSSESLWDEKGLPFFLLQSHVEGSDNIQ
ncbi:hypothetical protein DC345_00565 [Paenibacillus taichungensis]|uniref:Uncharacterized protein n=1 Tax=Paenibacillus taichungensis TaxID=484184 RepID=A0A329R7E4_9BACL|nr:hypothetical protein DC345_00565 [Paenibacillus taichungensis]